MSIQSFFPINPQFMTWEDWNGNFLHYYSEEPLMYAPENQWKEVARNIGQLTTFESYPVPNPDDFDNWKDWASVFSVIINGPST